MKVVVFGASGNLGHEILEFFKFKNYAVESVTHSMCDITSYQSVCKIIDEIKPDIIINTAAYNDVDRAEKEKFKAFLVNSIGPKNLALVAEKYNIKLIHYSTNFVFDGFTDEIYNEFDKTNPISVYGSSKLMGEAYVLQICRKSYVIRTSWLYGKGGNNFVNHIMDKVKNKEPLKVVNDQWASPTYAKDLAIFSERIVDSEIYGLYHFSNKGICNKAQFAKQICTFLNVDTNIVEVSTASFNSSARRPQKAGLDLKLSEITFNVEMRDWSVALRDYLMNFEVKETSNEC